MAMHEPTEIQDFLTGPHSLDLDGTCGRANIMNGHHTLKQVVSIRG